MLFGASPYFPIATEPPRPPSANFGQSREQVSLSHERSAFTGGDR